MSTDACHRVLGEPAISADALFEGVVHGLVAAGKPHLREHERLTAGLRAGLRALAEERGLQFHTGPFGQLLLDHVWKNNSGILLACESEWRRDDYHIRQDFEKLLYFKAPTKLFVFQSNPERKACDAQRIAIECLAGFDQHLAGEEYVIIELTPTQVRGFLCRVVTSGRIDAPRFLEVGGSPLLWEGRPR